MVQTAGQSALGPGTPGSARVSRAGVGVPLFPLPTSLWIWVSAPKARPHNSLGQRPTAIKLRNSRSRSQAPAWERPCLGGSSLPFLSGAPCFWRPGRRLEPPGILRSQAGAWERARVTRASKLNLMAVGQRPRSLIHNGIALNASQSEVLGRCPRLVWSRAVGPERPAHALRKDVGNGKVPPARTSGHPVTCQSPVSEGCMRIHVKSSSKRDTSTSTRDGCAPRSPHPTLLSFLTLAVFTTLALPLLRLFASAVAFRNGAPPPSPSPPRDASAVAPGS